MHPKCSKLDKKVKCTSNNSQAIESFDDFIKF